ncbi:unnamed protein product [Prunus brigantina]
MVQMLKGINTQVIEGKLSFLPLLSWVIAFWDIVSFCFVYVASDPSMASNLHRQAVQTAKVIDLNVFFGEEEAEHETLAEEKASEPTPSARNNKRKETTQAQDSDVQPDPQEAKKSSAVPPAEVVEKDITGEELAVVSSLFKPMIVAVSSSTTTSFADPDLAKFEAMDLEAQLLKL